MNRTPPELDKIVDVVLAYRPPDKKKKLATKAKKPKKKPMKVSSIPPSTQETQAKPNGN